MPKPPDDNDLLRDGTLPHDPEADAEPMPPPGLAPKLAELLPDAVRRMTARADGREKPILLPWPKVGDALGGGLWPGLHVLVGNTAAGKTQWVLQAALHAAKAGTPVLYIALEAGDVEFVARCLGLVSGRFWSPLYLGKAPDLHEVLHDHEAELERLPLHVLLGPPLGWDHSELPISVQKLREEYPEAERGKRPLLVVLDYLQIIGTGDVREDLRERIGKAAYVCRSVAREFDAAVIVASSTARENYLTLTGKRRGKKGGIEDAEPLGQGDPSRLVGLGKESGEIEFSADSVMALTQEPWPDHEPPRGGTVCHLAVAKVRAGVPSWVDLRFNGSEFSEPRSGSVVF